MDIIYKCETVVKPVIITISMLLHYQIFYFLSICHISERVSVFLLRPYIKQFRLRMKLYCINYYLIFMITLRVLHMGVILYQPS